ncbi:phage minor tail protein [Escherichia coli]|nr:phage minor tail protein [Escherichia coli]
MTAIPALAGQITTMVTQGYEYRRDDDMALWSSADLTYSITYEMLGRYGNTKSPLAGKRCRYHSCGLQRQGWCLCGFL